MSELVLFRPKSEIDANKNLDDLVEFCRSELKTFGDGLAFDDWVWDVSQGVSIKGRGKKKARVTFSTQQSLVSGSLVPMREPFLKFAQSYVRYMQAMRPTKALAGRVAALRALEAAICERISKPTPTCVDVAALNRAAQIIVAAFSSEAAYRVGQQLEMVADFLDNNRLVLVPLQWRNPIPRPKAGTRVGKEFDERRADKLPSQAALDALPKLFHLAKGDRDEITVAISAILLSAPDRINEVLLLPVNCEVRTTDSKGNQVYGLRWWPAKGAEPMVKWIIPSMVSVVEEAVRRIKGYTSAAREVAVWYENNPGKLYLKPECEYLRSKKLIGMSELAIMLADGMKYDAAGSWCKMHDLQLKSVGGRRYVEFNDVEKVIISMLPASFPLLNQDAGIRYSEALFLVCRNQLNRRKSVFNCAIEAISTDVVNANLGGGGSGGRSIFDIYGFAEPDGSPIRVTSHQFRHYLNTLAQAGGMSQLDIAKWSGRNDIRQNTAYDHVSADELVLKVRNALGDDRQMYGPLAELPKQVIISRDEFARLKVPTAHATEFGVCIRDYTMAPCQLHADCINCNEQVCIKGDEVRTARLRAELESARESLEAVRQAFGEGTVGASRWVEHHQLTVMRLTQLCAILDDPQVPDGAVIQLSNLPVVSRIEQAAENRAAALERKGDKSVPSDASMEAMRHLLAGMEM